MREKQIEEYLRDEVKARGGLCLKFTSPQRRSVPDRICLMPHGVTIFVECKAPGQKPTPQQVREHERFRALGHTVLVIDTKEGVDLYFGRNSLFF